MAAAVRTASAIALNFHAVCAAVAIALESDYFSRALFIRLKLTVYAVRTTFGLVCTLARFRALRDKAIAARNNISFHEPSAGGGGR